MVSKKIKPGKCSTFSKFVRITCVLLIRNVNGTPKRTAEFLLNMGINQKIDIHKNRYQKIEIHNVNLKRRNLQFDNESNFHYIRMFSVDVIKPNVFMLPVETRFYTLLELAFSRIKLDFSLYVKRSEKKSKE